jgi:hypothetical protein
VTVVETGIEPTREKGSIFDVPRLTDRLGIPDEELMARLRALRDE